MKGLLSKIEFIVIGIFALIFLVWAASKCSSSKAKLMEQAALEAREDSIANAKQNPAATTSTVQPGQQPATTTVGTTPAGTTPTQPTATTPGATATTTDSTVAAQKTATSKPAAPQEPQLSKLYVTIDKLKLRKSPGLKGELLGELKLFDEVFFMNEITDSTYQLSLGKEMADEPYVKIKTKRGTVGWVYGAGVHYHKKKRTGTLQ
jgi:hypothetical protein